MTARNDQKVTLPVHLDDEPVDITELGKTVISLDPRKTLIDYSGLNFKEMLLACPIDDIDLERRSDSPRAMEL